MLAAVVVASIYALYSTVLVAAGDFPAWLIGFWLLVGFIAAGLAQVASRSTVLIAAVLFWRQWRRWITWSFCRGFCRWLRLESHGLR